MPTEFCLICRNGGWVRWEGEIMGRQHVRAISGQIADGRGQAGGRSLPFGGSRTTEHPALQQVSLKNSLGDSRLEIKVVDRQVISDQIRRLPPTPTDGVRNGQGSYIVSFIERWVKFIRVAGPCCRRRRRRDIGRRKGEKRPRVVFKQPFESVSTEHSHRGRC